MSSVAQGYGGEVMRLASRFGSLVRAVWVAEMFRDQPWLPGSHCTAGPRERCPGLRSQAREHRGPGHTGIVAVRCQPPSEVWKSGNLLQADDLFHGVVEGQAQ